MHVRLEPMDKAVKEMDAIVVTMNILDAADQETLDAEDYRQVISLITDVATSRYYNVIDEWKRLKCSLSGLEVTVDD